MARFLPEEGVDDEIMGFGTIQDAASLVSTCA